MVFLARMKVLNRTKATLSDVVDFEPPSSDQHSPVASMQPLALAMCKSFLLPTHTMFRGRKELPLFIKMASIT